MTKTDYIRLAATTLLPHTGADGKWDIDTAIRWAEAIWARTEPSEAVEPTPVKPSAKPSRKLAQPIPPDWRPGPKAIEWIASFGKTVADAEPVIVEFRAYWQSRSKRYADWDLVFMRNPRAEQLLARRHGVARNVSKAAAAQTANADLRRDLDRATVEGEFRVVHHR